MFDGLYDRAIDNQLYGCYIGGMKKADGIGDRDYALQTMVHNIRNGNKEIDEAIIITLDEDDKLQIYSTTVSDELLDDILADAQLVVTPEIEFELTE